eukprot:8616453-Pyramimonas_sp.AAC.1
MPESLLLCQAPSVRPRVQPAEPPRATVGGPQHAERLRPVLEAQASSPRHVDLRPDHTVGHATAADPGVTPSRSLQRRPRPASHGHAR